MNFKHELIKMPELEQVNSSSGRYYVTPEGNHYSSVTTVLGAMSDKSGLDDWRKRVGDKEADRISRQAALRGTQFHSLCERYVLNEEIDTRRLMPLELQFYRQLKKALLKVDTIYGSENMLYSDRLKIAGSCDLICNWDNERAILDFKTSSKPKDEDWILNYFIQCTLYALMFYEMTGIMSTKIVVVIACDGAPEAQVFVKDTKDYIDRAVALCKKYHLKS